MAPNENQDASSASKTIPPPQDPFVTYQTSYPRNESSEKKNPFIEFRRAADQMIGSLFEGVPRLFGSDEDSANRRMTQDFEEVRQKIQQIKTAGNELAHRIMDQNAIAAFEEMDRQVKSMFQGESSTRYERSMSQDFGGVQPLEQQLEAAWKSAQEATRASAESQTAMRGLPVDRQTAGSCPALNGELSGTKEGTELDAYMHMLEHSNKEQVWKNNSPFATSKEGKVRSGWFSGLGWDGKQKQRWGECWRRYSLKDAHKLDPFETPSDIIPWAVLSPYSPVYLCNPTQPRMYRVKIQTRPNFPFRIGEPEYLDRTRSSEDDKLATLLPWADAFEDLASLSHTGQMIDRDYSTWRTPKTWFHDMVNKGSFGPTWGFNDDGELIRKRINQREFCSRRKQRNRALAEAIDTSPHEVANAGLYESVQAEKPNSSWSTMEDYALRYIVPHGSTSWDDIQRHFPKRTATECEDRYDTLLKEDRQSQFGGGAISRENASPSWLTPENVIAAVSDVRHSANPNNDVPQSRSSASTCEGDSHSSAWSSSSAAHASKYTSSGSKSSLTTNNDGREIQSYNSTTLQTLLPDGRVDIEHLTETEFADGTFERKRELPSNRNLETEEPALVSETTTSTSITLPNGKTEYRATVRRLLSDGTEESQQSVFQHPPSPAQTETPRSPDVAQTVEKGTQTSTPVQDALKEEKKRRGGWFWN